MISMIVLAFALGTTAEDLSPHKILLSMDDMLCEGKEVSTGFEGMSIATSVTHGVSRSIGSSLLGGKPEFDVVKVVKQFDGCSHEFHRSSIYGEQTFRTIFVSFTDQNRTVIRMELGESQVTQYRTTSSPDSLMEESFDIAFSKYCLCSRQFDAKLSLPDDFICVGYDISANQDYACPDPPAFP